MKAFLADLIQRLTSRKFLLALGGAIVCYANKDFTGLTAIVLGYLAINGATDIASTIKGE
jgi:hypothetical protein